MGGELCAGQPSVRPSSSEAMADLYFFAFLVISMILPLKKPPNFLEVISLELLPF